MDDGSKLKKILLGSFIGSAPFFLMLFVIFIVVLFMLGLFELDSSSTKDKFSYIYSTYSYCDSITMIDDGESSVHSLNEYIAGVVEAEAYMDESEEALKAQAIAARTYVLYKTDGCKKTVTNGEEFQTFKSDFSEKAKKAADDTDGLVLSYNGKLFESQYDSFCYDDEDCSDAVKNDDGTYTVTYFRLPTEDKHKITLSDSEQYSRIPAGRGHGRGMSQLVSYQLANEGKTYEEILKYFYSDGVEIVNLNSSPGTISDESGIGYTSTYTNSKTGKKYKNFKQCSFSGYGDICSFGCGLTSTSILVNADIEEYNPISFYQKHGINTGIYIRNYYPNRYESFDECIWGFDGWCVGTVESSKIGNSNIKEALISTLSNGGTALLFVNYSLERCLVGGVQWTSSQHFFTALDYNPLNNTIYISNPGTDSENQNGWLPLDNFDCVHISYLLYPAGS